MPYILDRKNKCIYKKNPDGSRGKKVGCTKGQFNKYVKALNTNIRLKERITEIVIHELNNKKRTK